MRTIFSTFFSAVLIVSMATNGEKGFAQNGKDREMPIELISTVGRELLEQSLVNHFVDWSVHFECQENLTYCGVASGVISLNLAGVEAPESGRHPSYKPVDAREFPNIEVRKFGGRKPDQEERHVAIAIFRASRCKWAAKRDDSMRKFDRSRGVPGLPCPVDAEGEVRCLELSPKKCWPKRWRPFFAGSCLQRRR